MRNFSFLSLFSSLLLLSSLSSPVLGQSQTLTSEKDVRRSLVSFKETTGNASFQCSPSGPCVACHYSEKNDEKYRCSETGYRIPLKCVEIGDVPKESNGKKFHKSRSALEDDPNFSSNAHPETNAAFQSAKELVTSIRNLRWRRLLDAPLQKLEGEKRTYITYRSCLPAVDDEKLSVLGFEGIMVCLFTVSATIIHYRRKRSLTMSGGGAVRIQSNSRF